MLFCIKNAGCETQARTTSTFMQHAVLQASTDRVSIERLDTPDVRQFAGIVTTGDFDVSVTSASAIRFCTTVNAYFESKSPRSIQYEDSS